jgi:hypothetical protein
VNFKTLTAEQIAAEIDRVTGQIVSYFSTRAQKLLVVPCEVPAGQEWIRLKLAELFNHVTGVAPIADAPDVAQAVCEALFAAPGTTGGNYEIPKEFWDTLTGKAVWLVQLQSLPDDALIESEDACLLVGVSRETLRNWRAAGKLAAADKAGATGGFRYRVGDVRALLHE